MIRSRFLAAAAAAALLGIGGPAAAPLPAADRGEALVFAVSARQPAASFSSVELRRIFLGEITRWKSGRRIALAIPPARGRAGRTFYDRVVRMSDIDYSQAWLGVVFRGEAAASPRVIATGEEMKKLLARSPDTLGVLLESDLDPGDTTLHALAIDGFAPGSPSYPFRLR